MTAVNQRPDANRVLEINARRVRTQRFDAANAERQRQISGDSTRLLQIASELKSDLEKAGVADLPLTAAAKADMIEKLARAVKEKMKLSVGAP